MAVSKNTQQVLWSSATSKSVTSGSNAVSDTVTFSANAFEADVTLKADNAGTPASGDTVTFFILYTTGDPDGSAADEFDVTTHSQHLATLDTSIAGSDPAIKTVGPIRTPKGCKIYAENNGASNAVTISAELYEYLG